MNYKRSQIPEKKLSSQIKLGALSAFLILFFYFWLSWTGGIPVNLEKVLVIPK
jgi:hypothetical protein